MATGTTGGLNDMSPTSALYNLLDHGMGHAVAAGDRPRRFSLPSTFAYIANRIISQFRVVSLLAPRHSFGMWPFASRPFCTTPLSVPVLSIVGMGAEKQMIGIDARRVIALMASDQPWWNRAIGQFIRHTMRRGLFVVEPVHPVSGGATSARPEPTALRLADVRPETFFRMLGRFLKVCAKAAEAAKLTFACRYARWGLVKTSATLSARSGDTGIVGVHGEPPIRCVVPRAVTSSAVALSCLIIA